MPEQPPPKRFPDRDEIAAVRSEADPDTVGGIVIDDLAHRRLVDRPPALRPLQLLAARSDTDLEDQVGLSRGAGGQPLEPAVERRGSLLPAGDGETEAMELVGSHLVPFGPTLHISV